LKGKLWTAQGVIEGDFGAEYLPTALNLRLKRGAQIMLLNNDASGRWINGTIARVTGFVADENGEGRQKKGPLLERNGPRRLHSNSGITRRPLLQESRMTPRPQWPWACGFSSP
jgi:hypothetical protein